MVDVSSESQAGHVDADERQAGAALDAICDTAGCAGKLDGTTIKVTSSGTPGGEQLPPLVFIALDQVAVPDVFREIRRRRRGHSRH